MCVSEVCPALEAEINMKRDVIFKQIHLQAAERHVCPAGVCMCVFRKSLCSHYLTSPQQATVNKCMHTHASTCIGASVLTLPFSRTWVHIHCGPTVVQSQTVVGQLMICSGATVHMSDSCGGDWPPSPVTMGSDLVCLVSGRKHL